MCPKRRKAVDRQPKNRKIRNHPTSGRCKNNWFNAIAKLSAYIKKKIFFHVAAKRVSCIYCLGDNSSKLFTHFMFQNISYLRIVKVYNTACLNLVAHFILEVPSSLLAFS